MDPVESVYLRLTITDVPEVWVDERQNGGGLARVTRSYWYRLPAQWCHDGALRRHRRRQLMDALYGPDRRPAGPSTTGYLVLELREDLLSWEQSRRRPWLGDLAGCFVWTEQDTLRPAVPAEM